MALDIATLIQNDLIDQLTLKCQAEIDPQDPTYARLVGTGNFQDDPTDYGVIIRVHRNDPDKTDNTSPASAWADERVTEDHLEMGLPVIGYSSPEYWWRRYVVAVSVWPVGKTQPEAQGINSTVVARARHAINTLVLSALEDEYGESISERANPLMKLQTNEGGGPDDEYSYENKLYLQYKTYYRPQ